MAEFDVVAFVAKMDGMGVKLTAVPLADGKVRVSRWRMMQSVEHAKQAEDLWIAQIGSNQARIDVLAKHLTAQVPPAPRGVPTQVPPAKGASQAPPVNGASQAPPVNGATQAPPMKGATQAPPMKGVSQAPPAKGVSQAPPAKGVSQALPDPKTIPQTPSTIRGAPQILPTTRATAPEGPPAPKVAPRAVSDLGAELLRRPNEKPPERPAAKAQEVRKA